VCRVEEDHRFTSEEADLGPAEGEDVDAGVDRHGAQREVERGGGVRDPGAVHVKQEAMRVGKIGEGPNFGRRVHGAVFARLRNRHDARLDVVLVADAAEPCRNGGDGQPAVRRRHAEELAAGEAFGGAAFVDVDVRQVGADHRLVGPHQRLNAEDVGAGAVEDEENVGGRPELRAERSTARAVYGSSP
jgi:hypothetical protein